MPIEKAFAIEAPPERIFAALETELREAAPGAADAFAVLRSDPPRALDLRVTIGGVPCNLSYRLAAKQGHTEVAGVLQPYGWRYTAFRIVTLGMRDQGFEIALVEGLRNLKAAVEGRDGAQDFPDEEDRQIAPPDE